MINDSDIKNINEDLLNFKPFVQKVARSIVSYTDKKSFVFSIEGEWGIGKTTFINFLINEIKNEKNIKIIQFNPWLISDMHQIFKLFFDELYSMILSQSTDAKWDAGFKDLKKMMSYLLPDEVELDTLILKGKYNVARRLEEKSQSLHELKEKINLFLDDLNIKIVIVIDDIDRLSDIETEQIFRLIKGVADFNNLIYILPYDKKIISNSLEKFKTEKGENYLEKIIQYQLVIPKPHKIRIKEILEEQLFSVFDIKSSPSLWNMIFNVIHDYIRTIRDINQIMNIINFEYTIVKDDVYFFDFLILSVIRIKIYSLYEKIKYHPELFVAKETTNDNKDDLFDKELKEFKKYEKIIKLIFDERISFSTSKIYNTPRLKYLHYVENYFSYSVSSDKISSKEYLAIKEKLFNTDYAEFKIEFLKNKNKFNYFLERLSTDSNKYENSYSALINSIKNNEINNDYLSLFNAIFITKKGKYIYGDEYKNIGHDIVKFYKEDKNIVSLKVLLEIYNHLKYMIEVDNDEFKVIKNILKKELENISSKDIIEENYNVLILQNFFNFEVDLESIKIDLNEYALKDNNNFFKIINLFINNFGLDIQFLNFICKEENIRSYIEKIIVADLGAEEIKIYEKLLKSYKIKEIT